MQPHDGAADSETEADSTACACAGAAVEFVEHALDVVVVDSEAKVLTETTSSLPRC